MITQAIIEAATAEAARRGVRAEEDEIREAVQIGQRILGASQAGIPAEQPMAMETPSGSAHVVNVRLGPDLSD